MTWYETAIQILLIGIANGSLIALVALGYTLVYGIIELINFAHGDVFMIGTMLALTIITSAPALVGVSQVYLMPPPIIAIVLVITLLASMVACGLLNVRLAGGLAGAAGAMFGLYNNTAWFFQGFRNGLYAFTAAVMGGIGNITGALLGGLLIGIIAAFSDFKIDPRWTQAVVFGILI